MFKISIRVFFLMLSDCVENLCRVVFPVAHVKFGISDFNNSKWWPNFTKCDRIIVLKISIRGFFFNAINSCRNSVLVGFKIADSESGARF